MPKHPELHHYSDRASFNRIMLLISAIAHHPGIGAHRQGDGVDAISKIQEVMEQIATERGIDYQQWSTHTLKKDLGILREYGILPPTTAITDGYYLGAQLGKPERVILPSKPVRPRKSALRVEEMQALRGQGQTYQQIGDQANLSRSRVQQILSKEDQS